MIGKLFPLFYRNMGLCDWTTRRSVILCLLFLLWMSPYGNSFQHGTSLPRLDPTFEQNHRRETTTSMKMAALNEEKASFRKKSSVTPGIVKGPDLESKPDYENIHGPLGKTLDSVFLSMFRSKMAEKVGVDSSLPKDDYQGLMELASAMNARFSDRTQVQKIAQDVLRALFPSWLPGQYAILFSKPFPEFSARMNAWATYVGGTWLMGECEVNDIEIDGKVYKDQGLLVKRCRFLEESGCASVCVNACKIPTQNFFLEDMGLPLTMTPDYETHECQFAFGQTPDSQEEFEAKNTPCLSRCPSAGAMRGWHDGTRSDAPASSSKSEESSSTPCRFMEVGE